LDETKRKVIYDQYQKIAAEQLPFIHLVQRLTQEAMRDRVEGVQYTALGGGLWNLYELKVSDQKIAS
jgi:peptide/nickel transport system substrate-binding protein